MSAETDAVAAADQELVHAMSALVRAIDAVGDEAAASHVSPQTADALQELAERISAAQGIG